MNRLVNNARIVQLTPLADKVRPSLGARIVTRARRRRGREKTEEWRRDYSQSRPHSSLRNVPPEEYAALNRAAEAGKTRHEEANVNDDLLAGSWSGSDVRFLC